MILKKNKIYNFTRREQLINKVNLKLNNFCNSLERLSINVYQLLKLVKNIARR